MRLKPLILHPMFCALAPLVSLWACNADEVGASTMLMVCGVAVIAAFLLNLTLGVATRDAHLGGCLASLFILLFFLFGNALELLVSRAWLPTQVAAERLVGVGCLVTLMVGIGVLWKLRRQLSRFTPILNLGASILLLTALIGLPYRTVLQVSARGWVPGEGDLASVLGVTLPASAPPRTAESPPQPDVYYIILDGYAREDVLETVYGFDNSEFIGWLRDQGFYVADQSVANYHKTVLSLPSSLNLNYLDEVGRRVSKDDRTRMSYHGLAQDHLVGRIFRSQGYRFVHFAAAYRATEDSAIADEVIRCYPRWMQSELAGVLSRTTALRPFGPKMARMHLHALEQLEAMPARPGPKFVFAHLILPHPPYVFDEHGNIRDDVPLDLDFEHVAGDRWSHQREYIHQLMYVNERMRVCLAAILAQSDPPPIIVLQSDHGPMSLAGRDPAALAASEPFIRERFPILNAYHVPDAMRESLYPEITPVNSFRVILNHLFLSEFELLDERCYYVLHDLSAGTEVTAIARRGAPSVDVVRSVQTSPGWSQAR